MRLLLGLGLCFVLAGTGMAQRGGGHLGGGFHGGGGYRGGGFRAGGGFHGGYHGYGHWGGYGYHGYGHWGYPGFYGGFWPYVGIGYWFGYYGYPYSAYPYYAYPSSYAYPYPYAYRPGVTVIYPPVSAPPAVSSIPSNSTARASSTQSGAGASPIYLIALDDRDIRAAESYWVEGSTLHYVTLRHQQQQIPLDRVDRPLTMQLNRERRISFQLPTVY